MCALPRTTLILVIVSSIYDVVTKGSDASQEFICSTRLCAAPNRG